MLLLHDFKKSKIITFHENSLAHEGLEAGTVSDALQRLDSDALFATVIV